MYKIKFSNLSCLLLLYYSKLHSDCCQLILMGFCEQIFEQKRSYQIKHQWIASILALLWTFVQSTIVIKHNGTNMYSYIYTRTLRTNTSFAKYNAHYCSMYVVHSLLWTMCTGGEHTIKFFNEVIIQIAIAYNTTYSQQGILSYTYLMLLMKTWMLCK